MDVSPRWARYRDPEKARAAHAKYQQTHGREKWLRLTYGISVAEYDAMLDSQNGVCAICEQPEPVPGRRLAVDHCHTTDIVRGLLCSTCNWLIGSAKDRPQTLRAAADYLEEAVERSVFTNGKVS